MDVLHFFESTSWTTIVASLVLVLYSIHYVSLYNFFSARGIKGPKPFPIFGSTLHRLFKPSKEIDLLYVKKYGKIHGYFDMRTPIINIADPAVIKKILVRDFSNFTDRREFLKNKLTKHILLALKGEEWRRTRNIMTPTFTSGKMKRMLPLMLQSSEQLHEVLDKRIAAEEDIEAKSLFSFFTLHVIAKCVFGSETDVQVKGYESGFLKEVKPIIMAPKWTTIVFRFVPRFIRTMVMNSQVAGPLHRLSEGIVNERNKPENKRNYKDFLQLMLDALAGKKDETDDDKKVEDSEKHHGHEHLGNKDEDDVAMNEAMNEASSSTDNKRVLTNESVVANALLFLFAGYETTSTLLTYASYILAKKENRDIQDKLREEVLMTYKAAGNQIRYEDVSSMEYMDAFISETLRMFPPALGFSRKCTEDYDVEYIDDKGIKRILSLRKGDTLQFPVYVIHHNEEYYLHPSEFKPDRFLPENKEKLIPYSYLPFGAGPRNCIGMRFALLEAKLCLMTTLLKYKFVSSDKTPELASLREGNEMLSPKNMFIKLEKV